MNSNKLEAFESKLNIELERLRKELESIATMNEHSKDWVATPISSDLKTADQNNEADGVEEWNERRASVAQLEIRYRNIDNALEKIKEKKFGICEVSGELIEEERLDANPAARTNIANMEQEKNLPF